MQDKSKAVNECKELDDGSDLLDDLDWLPKNHEIKEVIYFGKFLAVSSWEELLKHVSG